MRRNKEIVTAVGTLTLAIGIGFVMQSSDAAKQHYGVRPAPEVEVAPIKGANILPGVSQVTLTSAAIPQVKSASGVGIVADHLVSRVAVSKTQRKEESTSSCAINVSAEEIPGALINISLAAPCLPNERLTVHHNGLKFSETTDENGNLDTAVPALSEHAVHIVAFANGDGAVVQSRVEALAGYGRAVLQWRGDAGFQLHAREFGADYGTNGHIWAGTQQSASQALEQHHGFVLQLGNAEVPEPFLAEVYTYPLAQADRRGTIDLTIEAEVHARNCGLDIEAQSIELINGSVKTQDVVLAIPDCDAIGSFLVLNNLVSDMQVALK